MTSFSKPVQLPVGVGIENFTCGAELVDSWVANHSALARKRGIAVIYVSYGGSKVAGFYTLSSHNVCRSEISAGWLTRNASQQIPGVLLGMLGVDQEFKGQELGAALLQDAILNAIKVANLAGAKALVVDPLNESARSFYEHFGFSSFKECSRMALKLPSNG